MSSQTPKKVIWRLSVRVGDLVKYCIPSGGRIPIGLIIAIDQNMNPKLPYKVRWTDHSDSERDWYRKDELVPLLKVDDHLCRIAEG